MSIIRYLTDEEAIDICLKNYKNHNYKNDTVISSTVPWVLVGEIGVYTIFIRYYKLRNNTPTWSCCLKSFSILDERFNYSNFDDALKAAIKNANNKINNI